MKNMMEAVGQLNANPVNQTELKMLILTIREEVKGLLDLLVESLEKFLRMFGSIF